MMSQNILVIIKLGVFAGIILLCALFVLKFKRVRRCCCQMEPKQEVMACDKACDGLLEVLRLVLHACRLAEHSKYCTACLR